MSDKIKEVLTRLVAKSHGLPVDDLPDNASLLSPSLDIDQAAHQLNQMLIKEYRRGGYFELAKLKSHKIVSPDGVFNKAEQHKRLSKLAKEAGSTESGLNQMLIEEIEPTITALRASYNSAVKQGLAGILKWELSDQIDKLEARLAALKAEEEKT